jgi:hypothetical protein
MAGSKGNSLLPGVLRPVPSVALGGDGPRGETVIRTGGTLPRSGTPAMSPHRAESAVGIDRHFVLSSPRAG